MNTLFQQMNKNPYEELAKQLNEFSKTVQGNPQEQVQQLLNSGRVTQAQYDAAVRKGNMLRKFLHI
jgi:hypothetical protein